MDKAALIPLGKVSGTHGLRGDLKVRLFSGERSALLEAERVFFRSPSGEQTSLRPVRRTWHKDALLLHLEGLETIDSVQHLVGCDVLMPVEELPETEDEEFYWYQLKGLKVVDRERGEIGILEDLMATAAHDVYIVKGRFGEVLIPAVEDFILEIDPEKGLVVVDLPEGLVPETDDL